MDVVSGLDGFVGRLGPYDWIVMDASAFSIRDRREVQVSRKERLQYKKRLLEHMAADKRFVMPIGAFNALNEGYYRIVHGLYPNNKRDDLLEDIETELVLLAEQRIVTPQIVRRGDFARFKERHHDLMRVFDLYESTFDTIAKTLYLSGNSRVAFLSNTTQQLNALKHVWLSRMIRQIPQSIGCRMLTSLDII